MGRLRYHCLSGLLLLLALAAKAEEATTATVPCEKDDDKKEDKFTHFTEIFYTVIFIIVVWISGKIAAAAGAPSLVGEILVGVLLGPPVLERSATPTVASGLPRRRRRGAPRADRGRGGPVPVPRDERRRAPTTDGPQRVAAEPSRRGVAAAAPDLATQPVEPATARRGRAPRARSRRGHAGVPDRDAVGGAPRRRAPRIGRFCSSRGVRIFSYASAASRDGTGPLSRRSTAARTIPSRYPMMMITKRRRRSSSARRNIHGQRRRTTCTTSSSRLTAGRSSTTRPTSGAGASRTVTLLACRRRGPLPQSGRRPTARRCADRSRAASLPTCDPPSFALVV